MPDRRDLELLLSSGVPIVVVETTDEGRLLELLKRLADTAPAEAYRPLFRWSVTDGLQRLDLALEAQRHNAEPTDVLRHIRCVSKPGLYALLDFHPFLEDPVNVRLLKDIAIDQAEAGTVVLLISHAIKLPPELEDLSASFRMARRRGAASSTGSSRNIATRARAATCESTRRRSICSFRT